MVKAHTIKKTPSKKDKIAKTILIGIVALVIVASSVFIPQHALIFFISACFLGYTGLTFFNVEFEYILTCEDQIEDHNAKLDINIIYSKKRMKQLFTGMVRDFAVMTHINDTTHTNKFADVTETKNYASGITGNHTYIFLVRFHEKQQKIIFEPNEIMLETFAAILSPEKFFPADQPIGGF